jgi:hypothetical protein
MTITRLARGVWLGALFVVLVAGVVVLTVTRPGAPSPAATAAGSFLETFNGAPGAPQSFVSNTVAVTRTERNLSGDTLQPPHHSMHGPDCAGPPATFTNPGSREMSVFQCRDHIMTSITGTPYGLVYLTPAALVDWSGGSATIAWDQSTARSSARDFLSVWITPWNSVLDVPAPVAVDNDLNGAPLYAIHFAMDFFTDRITPEAYIGGALTFYRESSVVPYSSVVTVDNARRDHFELNITASSVELRLNGTVIARGDGVTVPFTSGMVQFGHHSYSPGKGCKGFGANNAALVNPCVNGNDIASANTWHWDNFSINPALPASFLQGAPDYSEGGRVTLNGAAPANSRLRFNAIGRVELSWDGGRTWAVAPVQPGNQSRDEYHVSNYWVPVPAGATAFDIRLSLDSSYPSHMLHAKDFTVWTAAAGAGGTLPTPTATLTTTPTQTATATGTATATQTATATAAQTATATATQTGTPSGGSSGGGGSSGSGTTSAGVSIVQSGSTSRVIASGSVDGQGSFSSSNGAFSLALGPGAPGGLNVQLRSLPATQLPAPLPGGASLLAGAAFALQLQDEGGGTLAKLASPFSVTLGLAGSGAEAGTLAVLQYDSSTQAWSPLPAVSYGGQRVTFRTDRPATYALVAAPSVTHALRGGGLSAFTFTGADGTLPRELAAQLGFGVTAIWRWNPATQDFDRYIPGAPALVNTLQSIDRRAVVFVRVTGADLRWQTPDLFTASTRQDVTLRPGLNAFGFTGDDAAVTALLASLGSDLLSAQAYDTASGTWRTYIPGGPGFVNTLSTVSRLQPLFVRVRSGATLQLGERGIGGR